MNTTTTRPLYAIAREIRQHAGAEYTKKGVWPTWYQYASHYVEALECLTSIDEDYYADSAKSVVLYTLSNLQNWRGEDARRIKAELKSLAGVK